MTTAPVEHRAQAGLAEGEPTEADPARRPRGGPRRDRTDARRRERIILAILFLVLVVITFGNQWGKFAPDTKPDLYFAPSRFLQGTLSAWLPELGQAGRGNFNTGMAPVAVVIYILRAIGLSPWLTIRVWRLGIFLIGAWGIRRYFHDLLDGRSNTMGRTVVTVLYLANAFVITQGNTTPELLPYALLPWLLLAQRRSLRQPRSWRVAAEFALVFFAMTGMNAGVVPLFLLVAIPCQSLAARLVDHMSWSDQARSLSKLGILSGALSLYWLLPTFLASSTGAGIAAATESPLAVAQTTSYGEIGRLLGHWPIYGRYGSRLYEPGYASYLTSPWVLGATFLIPTVAALAVWWAEGKWRRVRVTAAIFLVVAAPIEVGMFPPTDMPLFGRFIQTAFDKVPATLAFRTTSKIGPIVLIAFVLCVGIGAIELPRRSRGWPKAVRYGGVVAAIAVVAGSVYPALSNNLYDSAYKVPGYWTEAAKTLDKLPADSRIMAVPGGAGGNYRWGMRSPDDIFPSLFTRTVVSHVTVAGEGEQAANLMAGVDVPLNEDNLPPGSISTLARYLGAGQVLLRNDTRYEELTGAPPSVIQKQVDQDPDLVKTRTFGKPGEDMARTDLPASQQTDDLKLHPLVQYDVSGANPTVHSAIGTNTLLVDGDGFALPPLSSAGLLDGYRPFRYMGDMDPESLAQVIDDGGGIALTDTNRRRTWSINRLSDAYSRTLGLHDDIHAGDGPTLTLFPDRPSTQSVTYLEGVKNITASPLSFGEHAYGKPQMAFDSDPNTRWNAGPFGTAKGKQISVEFDGARYIDQVAVTVQNSQPARITKVLVQAGDEEREIDLGSSTIGVATFPRTRVSSVTVTVTGVSPGLNQVGIASIDIPGRVAQEVTRLPTTYTDLYNKLSDVERFRLGSLPVDVLFTRQASGTDPNNDEEIHLNREFSLPQNKVFTETATLAHLADAPQSVVDSWRAAPSADSTPCATLATLDEKPVSMRPAKSVARTADADPVDLVSCTGQVPLSSGTHQFRSIGTWRIQTFHLSAGAEAYVPKRSPRITVVAQDDTHLRLRAEASKDPFYLVTGQAYDPRWTAYVDGKDLGEPISLNGYSVAWRIPPGPARRIDVAYGPQKFVTLSFGLSAVALVGVIVLLAAPVEVIRRRRRRSEVASGDGDPS